MTGMKTNILFSIGASLPHVGGLHHQFMVGCLYCIGKGQALPLIEGVYTSLRAFLLLVIRSRVEFYNW